MKLFAVALVSLMSFSGYANAGTPYENVLEVYNKALPPTETQIKQYFYSDADGPSHRFFKGAAVSLNAGEIGHTCSMLFDISGDPVQGWRYDAGLHLGSSIMHFTPQRLPDHEYGTATPRVDTIHFRIGVVGDKTIIFAKYHFHRGDSVGNAICYSIVASRLDNDWNLKFPN